MIIELKAFVSKNLWSYVINESGNAQRLTLPEYGSCTPQNILQSWLDNLDENEKKRLSNDCDIIKDTLD